MTDIVPRVMKQKGRSRYEGQESLMVRASEWIQNQTHVTVTNIQTVTFRRRGKASPVYRELPSGAEVRRHMSIESHQR